MSAMSSNVGNPQVYNDGDQKNVPQSEIQQEKQENRFHEGKENSHLANDSSMNQHYYYCKDTSNIHLRG